MPTLAEQLEAFIVRSHLAPGARLPPERTLAADLGVSRSRLRETIQQLVSRGLIVSRRGGGNFIAEPAADLALDQALKPLQPLAESEAGYWRDIQEIRQSLETNAAYYAALRAGQQDKERLTAALDAVCAASDDAAVQSRADAAFHLAIAEASHNLVLRQVMSGLFNLLKVSIAESLTKLHQLPDTVEALNAQHRSIVEAILAGRAEEARHAAALHLSFVEDRLRHIEEEAARLRRATALRHTIPQEDTSP